MKEKLRRLLLPVKGVALLVAALTLGSLFMLFPYADRQSVESALRIVASTLATFVGFILVALALIAGRASDAREHLEAVVPRYKDSSSFNKIRSDYRQAFSSQSISLDERPALGPYGRDCAYTHREIYAALEAIHLMLLMRMPGMPGAKDVVMGHESLDTAAYTQPSERDMEQAVERLAMRTE